MKSTVTAHSRATARARTPAMSRLGPWHFGLLVSVLLLFALLFVLALQPYH